MALVCSVVALLLVFVLQRVRRWNSHATEVTDPKTAAINAVAFHNLVIESGHDTPYVEIDELIVSPYGIFCIEEKSRGGYIFGSYDREQWTQFKYGERTLFQNPLHQNDKHIKALEKLLGNRLKKPIHSIVLFTNAKLVEVADHRVLLGRHQLTEMLSRHSEPIYTIDEYRKICEILAYESTMSEERMPEHIASLRQRFAGM